MYRICGNTLSTISLLVAISSKKVNLPPRVSNGSSSQGQATGMHSLFLRNSSCLIFSRSYVSLQLVGANVRNSYVLFRSLHFMALFPSLPFTLFLLPLLQSPASCEWWEVDVGNIHSRELSYLHSELSIAVKLYINHFPFQKKSFFLPTLRTMISSILCFCPGLQYQTGNPSCEINLKSNQKALMFMISLLYYEYNLPACQCCNMQGLELDNTIHVFSPSLLCLLTRCKLIINERILCQFQIGFSFFCI